LPATATVIDVPGDYPTIQGGIEASSNWDTVLVADGHYYERINFCGKDITVVSRFIIDGDTAHIHNTIIDADTLVLGVADTGSVVCFAGNEYISSILRGFTIKNGVGTTHTMDLRCGGGIFCYYASPSIEDNIIVNNSAGYLGGGIFCNYSNAIVKNNVIAENAIDGYNVSGGGISCVLAGIAIENNIIRDNHCRADVSEWGYAYGGAIYCDYSSPTILYNVISGNRAVGFGAYGGGISLRYGYSFTSGNIIAHNQAISEGIENAYGGGVSCEYYSGPTLINNVITSNSASFGGGFSCAYHTSPTLINNIFWADTATTSGNEFFINGDSATVAYCDIQGGWEGQGNIDLLPLFRDAVDGDYHLMSTACADSSDSPCIDAGDPSVVDNVLNCNWGLGTVRSDMGAFGGQEIRTEIGGDDNVIFPSHFSLLQNYPNPFNATTAIKFILPETGDVTLSIYNIIGQRVAILFEGTRQAGEHTVNWDASGFPSGIYFARLEAMALSKNIRMVLLK
jgi:hypothetical protein